MRRFHLIGEKPLIFGQTIFQSVLERLEADEAERFREDEPVITIRGLNSSFVAHDPGRTDFGPDIFSNLQSAYFAYSSDDLGEQTAKAPTPVKPAHLNRLQLAEIARDLDLNAQDTLETLARKRRAFAQENHPDVIPEEWRESANIRMKLANLLIDEAQKQLIK